MIAAILLALASVADDGMFDLNCVGAWESNATARRARRMRTTMTFRIDLAGGRWCQNDCRITWPIVSSDAQKLVLEASSTRSMGLISHVTIFRESSAIAWFQGRVAGNRHFTGVCEPMPFSGFPLPKF